MNGKTHINDLTVAQKIEHKCKKEDESKKVKGTEGS
jgi:hypothetical protein